MMKAQWTPAQRHYDGGSGPAAGDAGMRIWPAAHSLSPGPPGAGSESVHINNQIYRRVNQSDAHILTDFGTREGGTRPRQLEDSRMREEEENPRYHDGARAAACPQQE